MNLTTEELESEANRLLQLRKLYWSWFDEIDRVTSANASMLRLLEPGNGGGRSVHLLTPPTLASLSRDSRLEYEVLVRKSAELSAMEEPLLRAREEFASAEAQACEAQSEIKAKLGPLQEERDSLLKKRWGIVFALSVVVFLVVILALLIDLLS